MSIFNRDKPPIGTIRYFDAGLDVNITAVKLHKGDIIFEGTIPVAEARKYNFGGRTAVIAPDGSTIFAVMILNPCEYDNSDGKHIGHITVVQPVRMTECVFDPREVEWERYSPLFEEIERMSQ